MTFPSPEGLQVFILPIWVMFARRTHEPILLVAVMVSVPLLMVAMPRTGSKRMVPVPGEKDAGLPAAILTVLSSVSPDPMVEAVPAAWTQLVAEEAVEAMAFKSWIT